MITEEWQIFLNKRFLHRKMDTFCASSPAEINRISRQYKQSNLHAKGVEMCGLARSPLFTDKCTKTSSSREYLEFLRVAKLHLSTVTGSRRGADMRLCEALVGLEIFSNIHFFNTMCSINNGILAMLSGCSGQFGLVHLGIIR